MTFKEIFENKNFEPYLDNNQGLWQRHIENKSVVYTLTDKINWDDKVELWYYWYDHLYRIHAPKIVEKIEKWAQSRHIPNINEYISNHNWEDFVKYYHNEKLPITLPTDISVSCGDYIVGSMRMCEETMQYIDYHEYECG